MFGSNVFGSGYFSSNYFPGAGGAGLAKANGLCQKCGKLWWITDTEVAFFFSSDTYHKGDYVSARDILILGEDIKSCPNDPGAPVGPRKYLTGYTPSGGSMYEGSDRYTAGDETHPSKHEL